MALWRRLDEVVRGRARGDLQVQQAMTTEPVTVPPDEKVRTAANQMAERDLAATVVESDEPAILTARNVLELVGEGDDPDAATVGDHCTPRARTISRDSPLDEAAEAMVVGDFRHLIVTDADRTVGLLAMRDVVRCWVEALATPTAPTPIREAMNTDYLTLHVDCTVQEAAHAMSGRDAAAAVIDPTDGRPYPGIFTEREVLHSLDDARRPTAERLGDHVASSLTFSAPGWSLKQAAEAMTEGGFQHIVVVDPYEIRGVISMRDVVRHWTEDRE